MGTVYWENYMSFYISHDYEIFPIYTINFPMKEPSLETSLSIHNCLVVIATCTIRYMQIPAPFSTFVSNQMSMFTCILKTGIHADTVYNHDIYDETTYTLIK
jgi:hypothetical protein